jgi:c-di-GMP-binding flagellar brake protein YcgR
VTVRRARRGADRRRFTRVDGSLVVACKPVAPGPEPIAGRTLNFSAGGVLFVSPTPVEAGIDVEIVLRLPPGDDDVRFTARVVRVRTLSDHAHELAAEFAGGDASAQRALLDYIAEHAGSYDPEPIRPISA